MATAGAVRMRDANGGVTVSDAVIEDSDADRWGGAVSFAGSTNGSGNPIAIVASQLRGNTAGDDGGAVYGSLFANGGDNGLLVDGSTLTGNSTTAAGGAIYGASIVQVIVRNSTLTANSADEGGGAVALGAGAAEVDLRFSTITANTTTRAAGGAGIQSDTNGQSVNFTGSILSGNLAAAVAANCAKVGPATGAFTVTSSAYNVESPDSCGLDADGTDLVNTDPQLGPLAANDGSTRTSNPAAASPAVDRVRRTLADGCALALGVDQRGEARPAAPAGLCDVGAVERTPDPPDADGDGITPPPPPPAAPPPPPPPAAADVTAPALSALRVSPGAFLAASSGASLTTRAIPSRGTKVGFRLTEAARVTFTVVRRAGGRRVGGGRRAKSPSNLRKPRCDLTLHSSFSATAGAGAKTLHFSGRLGDAALTGGATGFVRRRATAPVTGARRSVLRCASRRPRSRSEAGPLARDCFASSCCQRAPGGISHASSHGWMATSRRRSAIALTSACPCCCG